MISTIMKMSAARKAVQLLGGAEKDMEVLILHDPLTIANVEPLAIAADEVGARVITMQMTPSKYHGKQLSPVVGEAMKAADLVIGLAYQNIAHTQARLDAQLCGTKVMVLPESDSDNFFLAAGWDADFTALRPEIDAVASALTNAERARVWSKDGTDITMSIAGREGRSLNGFVNTKDISAGYCLESSLAPVEGTAEGRIVVNASIPGVALIKKQFVEIIFKKGLAVSIEGGPEAIKFRNLLASFNDPNVYNLGELGLGMNPECTLDGTMLSDESVYGGFQLALGTSAYIGGTCKAAAHYDTVITNACLELDGKKIFEGDRLLIPY
jgi:leucyl aminopeptidase (aminopeptidase T)